MLRIVIFIVCTWTVSAQSLTDIYTFPHAYQQQQFTHLLNQLRCLVCQNQSLADSNAPLAQDLRQRIAQMVLAGASEKQVQDFLVTRYSEFILYQPAWNSHTAFLWLFPFCLLLACVIVILCLVYRGKSL